MENSVKLAYKRYKLLEYLDCETIRELAEAADVCIPTVYKMLNGFSEMYDKTWAKIGSVNNKSVDELKVFMYELQQEVL